MNLFNYDAKHENVMETIELGHLSDEQLIVAKQIVDFTNEKVLKNSACKQLVLAQSYSNIDSDGFNMIVFDGEPE